jgi:hypothetical protein
MGFDKASSLLANTQEHQDSTDKEKDKCHRISKENRTEKDTFNCWPPRILLKNMWNESPWDEVRESYGARESCRDGNDVCASITACTVSDIDSQNRKRYLRKGDEITIKCEYRRFGDVIKMYSWNRLKIKVGVPLNNTKERSEGGNYEDDGRVDDC